MKPWIALVLGILIGWLIGWLFQMWMERRQRPQRLEIPREPVQPEAERFTAQAAGPVAVFPAPEASAADVPTHGAPAPVAVLSSEPEPEFLPELHEAEHEAPPEVNWSELRAEVQEQAPLAEPVIDDTEHGFVVAPPPEASIGSELPDSPVFDTIAENRASGEGMAPAEPVAPSTLTDEALAGIAPSPDDLIVIEGIGPVYAAKLNAAGITTFARLATASPDELAAIIQAPTWRKMYFEEWIEQAALLRDHEDAKLKELQERLFRRKKA